MKFFAYWKSQLDSSIQEFAQLATATDGIDFRYGWLATALLWPIRTPIQEFDGDAMDAVRDITGAQTKHILKVIQSWDEDRIAAARTLAQQAKDSPEIALALSAVINRFDATAVFAGHLAQVLMQPHGGGDVYNISAQIKAALVNIAGVMNIQSLAINLSLPREPVVLTRERRNELALLQKVRTFWVEGVLERSLHGVALLELHVQPAAGAVDTPHPWEMMLDLPNRPGENALPPSTHLIEVFDGLEKEGDPTLLILGEPGSGKTITLLELARDMLIRAEQEAGHPLPVVFNLSAWGEKRLPFDQWLLEDLNQRYQIPRKIGRMWLENQALLLLLDGLDEVSANLRNDCVEAINTFRLEHGLTPIVVCSRIQEYEVLQQHLRFQRGIRLLPLTAEQVEAYLQMVGEPLVSLRLALAQDQTLRELARSPLMLNVMSLAYRDLPEQTLLSAELQATEARRKHLFGTYVKRMFQRRSDREVYSPSQTVNWLSWLARNMSRHNQSVFSLENIQPTWLSTRPWRWMYLLLSRPIAGMGAMGVILFFVYSLGDKLDLQTITFSIICSVIFGVALAGVDALWLDLKVYFSLALYYFLTQKYEDAFRRITFSFVMFDWLIGGLTLLFSRIAGNDIGFIPFLLSGIPFALIFGLRVGLPSVLFQIDVRTRENLNYSWSHLRRTLIYGSFLPGILIFSVAQFLFLSDLYTGLILWNVRDGSQVKAMSEVTSEITAVEFSLDGRRLVSTGHDGTIQLWDGQSGELVKTLEGRIDPVTLAAYESYLRRIKFGLEMLKPLGVNTASLHTAVFSPDGTRLVTAANDMKLQFWNGKTGQSIPTQMGLTIWINTAIFSPDGTRLVTANADGVLQLRDGQSGVLIQPQMGQISSVDTAIFSANGTRLVTVNHDKNLVQLWDGRTGELVKTLKMQVSRIHSAVFNLDGTRLATGGIGSPELWDGQTGEWIKTLVGNVNTTIAFTTAGTRLVTGDADGTIRLWDGQTGKLVRTLNQDSKIPLPHALFSSDGARLVTFSPYFQADVSLLSTSPIAQLWDGQTGEPINDLNMGDFFKLGELSSPTLAFSRDGTRLVTTCCKGVIKLWDGQTGYLRKDLDGHTDQVDIVVFSPDGTRLMTAGRDGIVQLWDTQTGKRIKMLGQNVTMAQLSPDGMRIATAKKLSDYRGWTFLAIIGFLVGCLTSFQTGVVETKRKPNQGIHLTARNALIVALFIAGLVFITIFVSFVPVSIFSDGMELKDALARNLEPANLFFGGILSGTIAFLVMLGYGGLDVLYHYTLRFLLILQRCIPMRYAHFLDYASERVFLQKVGGSYIFTHRLLLEYFASLDETEIANLTK